MSPDRLTTYRLRLDGKPVLDNPSLERIIKAAKFFRKSNPKSRVAIREVTWVKESEVPLDRRRLSATELNGEAVSA